MKVRGVHQALPSRTLVSPAERGGRVGVTKAEVQVGELPLVKD